MRYSKQFVVAEKLSAARFGFLLAVDCLAKIARENGNGLDCASVASLRDRKDEYLQMMREMVAAEPLPDRQ